MGFYDDLKNPPKKEHVPEIPYPVLSSAERQKLATAICGKIRDNCRVANNSKKRSHCAYYDGHIHKIIYDPGYRRSEWIDFTCGYFLSTLSIRNNQRHLPIAPHQNSEDYSVLSRYWTAAERDQILPLVRKELMADGFPADVVSAHDDLAGAVGYGIFKRGGEPVYTIKADIRW